MALLSLRALLACLVLAATVCPSWQQKSKVVEFAPEADLENGDDDISAKGNCASEIKRYCEDIEEGEGQLADCISDKITESETANGAESAISVADSCREELYQYKIERNKNINKNVPLAKACKVDADKFCNVTWFFGYKAGQVVACLRDVKDKLAPACKREIFKVQLDAANDYRADPQLHEACQGDADTLCAGVKVGGGRVQACLRSKRMQLSWDCEEQLFRQEAENADDIRLSVRLFTKCLGDKKKFCPEVRPGNAAVKDCLEQHRNANGFTTDCKEEIEEAIEGRVRDFRLDARLRRVCEADIYAMCAFYGDLESEDVDDASVVRCLQDYEAEIKSAQCKQLVHQYQELASEDIRFDVPLADACFEDRQKLCDNVPPGSARVIRCLQTQRTALSPNCRAVLFDEEVRFSENIDFQYPMKAACKKEMATFCKDIPHGQSKTIRCLQDNKAKPGFSKECKKEVQEFEQNASQDYRLNYRLRTACEAEVHDLCEGLCNFEDGSLCGGTVLRCLTQKKEEVRSESCKKEIFYFEKMEVSDFRNDVILAAACRQDVEMYCSTVEPGEGRVHACLRKYRKKLSTPCRQEELLLEQEEAENVELRPSLLAVCSDERSMFCKEVAPGSARVFRCLAEKVTDPDFGEACADSIMEKLRRRQSNWKLDPPLRRACRANVAQLCADVDDGSEEGLVYKCLATKYEELDLPCAKELGRAYHMALFSWGEEGTLTDVCDNDVERLCISKRPNIVQTPGAVATCLYDVLDQIHALEASPRKYLVEATVSGPAAELGVKCRDFVEIAEPPNTRQQFEAGLSAALLTTQLARMQSATGWSMLNYDESGNVSSIALSGWMALLGVAALMVVLVSGLVYGWRAWKGMPAKPVSKPSGDSRGAYMVVKQRPVAHPSKKH